MDIGKAFSFVFEDERWVSKVLIGGLLIWIPIVNFAALGYALKVAQNVAQGNPRPLPEWGEFGDHFMLGLYEFVIRLVYSLPIIILGLLYACVVLGIAGGSPGQRGNNAGGAYAGLLGLCFVPLIIVLSLAIVLVFYAALARFVATNSLGEALKFGEVIASVRRNVMPWVLLLVVGVLAGFVGGLGAIVCGVGALFTLFYAQCVIGHALGQTVAEQGMAAGGYTQTPPNYGPPPTYQ
jgi:hypothetical protein